MRAVVQRVSKADVTISGKIYSKIDHGLLVLLGVEQGDDLEDVSYLVAKLIQLRIFNDLDGKMNQSIVDVNGDFLVVSQFTLLASTKKGNRPGYANAASPDVAIQLYQVFIDELKKRSDLIVENGQFAADMKVGLVNDGPVTILMDSKRKE